MEKNEIQKWFEKNNIFRSLSTTDKIIIFVLIFFIIATFGMSIYSVVKINDLLIPKIDALLYIAGSENNTLSLLEDFKTIYMFDTKNYNFESLTSYSGYFRVIIKTVGNLPLSSISFRVLDSKGRNITSNDIVVPQNNMAINFKTVDYSEFLSLQATINQTNVILESLSIHARGDSVKGFL